MKNIYSFLFILLVSITVSAQNQTVHKSFENEKIDLTKIQNDLINSEYAHIGFTPTFTKGLKGLALDLTSDVPVRIPVVLDKSQIPAYDKNFAVELWVKTKPAARQGTPIMSNKKNGALNSAGWIIGTRESGAWFFNISDGENSYTYEPTSARQAINDGNWHQIAVSVDFSKNELWLYFDGTNVAIYNLEGLSSANGELLTVIGGSDEYNDWGSRREWTAFNGMIDEVKLYTKNLSSSEVKTSYQMMTSSGESDKSEQIVPSKLKVQVWNIWHGGHRSGNHVGLERVIDVLKRENADVIGLIETYGSGAIIADSLGYYFYLISSNLSIMSRYPIESTVKVFQSFNSGGAILDLGNNNKVAFFDIWLDYRPNVCDLFDEKTVSSEFMEKDSGTRLKEIKAMLSEIKKYTDNASNVPVIMVGDFNCGSHLDWTERTKSVHKNRVIDWPVSKEMLKAGFADSFRTMNPDPLSDPGYTWSPLINNATVNQNCIRDRIDFIYSKGNRLQPYWSKTLDHHPVFWPSDHASVTTYFYFQSK